MNRDADAPPQDDRAVRDIPASCTCDWELRQGLGGYRRTGPVPGCPWHQAAAPEGGPDA